MGVDVNLYAEGDVTDERLAEANTFMVSRGVRHWQDGETMPLSRCTYIPGRVEWGSPNRYYGIGYERGHWPEIHNAIVCLRAALPECTVYYGGDTGEDGVEATDECLTELWSHWLSPDGDAYHQRREAWNAAYALTRPTTTDPT